MIGTEAATTNESGRVVEPSKDPELGGILRTTSEGTEHVETESAPTTGDQTQASAEKTRPSLTSAPLSPAEDQKLRVMRDGGNSWSEIAKVCSF
jgi:hypothetical protein